MEVQLAEDEDMAAAKTVRLIVYLGRVAEA